MGRQTFKKRGVDYPLVHGTRTMPGKYYHSKKIYKKELNSIFYKYWVLAGREEEIPDSGNFKLVNIGEEELIMVRDKKGSVRAHYNVCKHRGTQLCTEKQGKFNTGHIQCPYHAWTYDLTGNLVAAPMMKEGENFNKKEAHLSSAHIHIWEGFIFISLADDPVSFDDQMKALVGKFSEWGMSDLKIGGQIDYHLDCNWKLILQNYQECYHCPGVHPLLCELTPFQSAQHDASDGAVIGGFMELAEGKDSMTMNGSAATTPLVSGDHLRRIYYYSIFPNMLLTPHPGYVMYHHIIPQGPEKIINRCYWLFHPDALDDPGHKEGIASAIDFWDLTNKQDWQVCEQMQIGTRSRSFDRGYYSAQEDMLVALDDEVKRALGEDN